MSEPNGNGRRSSLLSAMCAVQAAAPALPKDSTNPHFNSKFAGLATIVATVGPLLAENDLVWSTMPCRDEHGQPALRYRLAHAGTGEVLEDVMPLLLTKQDPQGMGSAITYARRYALCAVLNLVADDDDDGNGASARGARGAASGTQPTARAPQPADRPATAKQRGLMNTRASDAGLSAAEYASAILAAASQPPRTFETDEQALGFIGRQLDRLPGRLVDTVLQEISNVVDARAAA